MGGRAGAAVELTITPHRHVQRLHGPGRTVVTQLNRHADTSMCLTRVGALTLLLLTPPTHTTHVMPCTLCVIVMITTSFLGGEPPAG